MEILKNCPFCGQTPHTKGAHQEEVWCANITCKIYNILMTREEWQIRPLEEAKEEKVLMLKEDIKNRIDSFVELNKKYDALQSKYKSMIIDVEKGTTSLANAKEEYENLKKSFNTYRMHATKENNALQAKLDDEKKTVEYYKESLQNSANSFTALNDKYETLQTKLNDEKKAVEYYKGNVQNSTNSFAVLKNKYDILQVKYDNMASDITTTRATLVKIKGEYEILQKAFDTYKVSSAKENSIIQTKLNDEKKNTELYKENMEKRLAVLKDALEKIYNVSSDVLKSVKGKQ